ncbi:hypothetical protein MUN88_17070 [Gracilibacillus caseinilyticus]|uniref:Uncharacterized protein n=1 Tax=Gracilibacillus caseinilyticus TaxID=2932256 RepID=A0ABY4EVR1_9BACI|nr:hypothetical protein [Gracilibacillus caseinilyticus]UOQ47744.1 hypothetical protein MUN88_17070 [Gracilibacillus caseinilyticus]
MQGKIVSSNGAIQMEQDTERFIKFDMPLEYFNFMAVDSCIIYLNGSKEGISIPKQYTQPFEIKDFPIWSFKVCRHGHSLETDNDGLYKDMEFYYYGYY